ncbi:MULTISPECIES: DUF3558 family protein [Nocardia]|uniref:DUF3558 family protein n=1 Tax=Nocardia TaxID=1817 RepID=UPI0013001F93|nr:MULTISPECIES: DUF3558 family protein [Nocardia]
MTLLAGCGSGSDHGDPISVRVGAAAIPVHWDPCTEIVDDIPTQLGFDPATRERVDYNFDAEKKTGCRFDRTTDSNLSPGQLGWFTILAINTTFEQWNQLHPKATRVLIDSREAILIPEGDNTCTIAMPGPDGSVSVRLAAAVRAPDWRPCDQIDHAAKVVAATLP